MADDGNIDAFNIPGILRRWAKQEVDGFRTQILIDAATEIEKGRHEIERLNSALNLETARRFATDNPPAA